MAKLRNMSWGGRLLLAVLAIASVVFLPTTILMAVGILPTVVARMTDRTPERMRVLTVGFMNFAGCFPFWFQLMETGHKIDNSLAILSDPLTVVVMYACALIGYVLEWVSTAIVSGLMVQKGKSRLENIKKYQADLVKKWGTEVSGEIPIDEYGFPVEGR